MAMVQRIEALEGKYNSASSKNWSLRDMLSQLKFKKFVSAACLFSDSSLTTFCMKLKTETHVFFLRLYSIICVTFLRTQKTLSWAEIKLNLFSTRSWNGCALKFSLASAIILVSFSALRRECCSMLLPGMMRLAIKNRFVWDFNAWYNKSSCLYVVTYVFNKCWVLFCHYAFGCYARGGK